MIKLWIESGCFRLICRSTIQDDSIDSLQTHSCTDWRCDVVFRGQVKRFAINENGIFRLKLFFQVYLSSVIGVTLSCNCNWKAWQLHAFFACCLEYSQQLWARKKLSTAQLSRLVIDIKLLTPFVCNYVFFFIFVFASFLFTEESVQRFWNSQCCEGLQKFICWLFGFSCPGET